MDLYRTIPNIICKIVREITSEIRTEISNVSLRTSCLQWSDFRSDKRLTRLSKSDFKFCKVGAEKQGFKIPYIFCNVVFTHALRLIKMAPKMNISFILGRDRIARQDA